MMKYIQIILVVAAFCTLSAWAVPQDMIPLKALKDLAEGQVPDYDTFEAFEPLLGAQLSTEEQPQAVVNQDKTATGVSLIDAESGVGVDLEAQRAAAQELQFARIQYLQAAIADKRSELRKQKATLDQEVEQLKHEKQLVSYNRRIISENEKQINLAQAELAKLLESYSENVKSDMSLNVATQPSSRVVENKVHKAKAQPKPAAAPAAAEEAPEIFVEVDASTDEMDMEHEAEANLAEADSALEAMMSLSEEAELFE